MPTNAEIDAEIARRQQVQEIDAEIARRQQAQQPPELTLAERLKGTVEGIGTLATSAIAEPVAGIFGAAAALNPFAEEGAGAAVVETVRNALTFKPESREVQDAIAGLGQDMQFIVEPLQNLKAFLGDDAFNATGSPAIATLLSTLPDALLLAPMIPKAPKGLPKIKSKPFRTMEYRWRIFHRRFRISFKKH